MSDRKTTIEYNDRVVRQFMLAAILWGVVGMLVGVLIASQLNFWRLNFNLPWLTFGRLRPLIPTSQRKIPVGAGTGCFGSRPEPFW
jgi:cytochrome c oxidase cbb3-type subunit I/II